jgi:hypothetical protein
MVSTSPNAGWSSTPPSGDTMLVIEPDETGEARTANG